MSKKKYLSKEADEMIKKICLVLPTIPKTNSLGDPYYIMDKAFGSYIYSHYNELLAEGRVLLPKEKYANPRLRNKKLNIARVMMVDTYERIKKAYFKGTSDEEVKLHKMEAERFIKRSMELQEKDNTISVDENS